MGSPKLLLSVTWFFCFIAWKVSIQRWLGIVRKIDYAWCQISLQDIEKERWKKVAGRQNIFTQKTVLGPLKTNFRTNVWLLRSKFLLQQCSHCVQKAETDRNRNRIRFWCLFFWFNGILRFSFSRCNCFSLNVQKISPNPKGPQQRASEVKGRKWKLGHRSIEYPADRRNY